MMEMAFEMCVALLVVGILASLTAGSLLPLVPVGLAAYVVWRVGGVTAVLQKYIPVGPPEGRPCRFGFCLAVGHGKPKRCLRRVPGHPARVPPVVVVQAAICGRGEAGGIARRGVASFLSPWRLPASFHGRLRRTTLWKNLIKTVSKTVRHTKYATFQLVEVASRKSCSQLPSPSCVIAHPPSPPFYSIWAVSPGWPGSTVGMAFSFVHAFQQSKQCT